MILGDSWANFMGIGGEFSAFFPVLGSIFKILSQKFFLFTVILIIHLSKYILEVCILEAIA